MRKRIRSAIVLAAALALTAVVGAVVAFAENIDPFDAGDQYAWGENVGWLNAEPSGNGGPGVHVYGDHLEGYMWGENIGWVNMSCQNTGNCAGPAGNWGVTNNGAGNLSGYAWGENVGWISFSDDAPVAYGVTINPATGTFGGYAWGENIGWISFSDDAPVDYAVVTSWIPPVGGIAELPDIEAPPRGPPGSSGRDYTPYAAGAALVMVIAVGAWYARRRWPRP